jgi:hypothetical protein
VTASTRGTISLTTDARVISATGTQPQSDRANLHMLQSTEMRRRRMVRGVGAAVILAACNDPRQGSRDQVVATVAVAEDSVAAPEPAAPPSASSATDSVTGDPFAVASTEPLGPPPKVRCTLASLKSKVVLNKTPGFLPGLQCDWKSAEQRFWGRKDPTAKLSVAIHTGADVARIAKEMRATRWERRPEDENLYVFRFASTNDAIDAIRPLLCHPQVIGASMSLLMNAQDDEELDAWCEDFPRRPHQH